MYTPTEFVIRRCAESLQAGYRQIYGVQKPEYADLIEWVTTTALDAIATSDALYHNVEHTILVAEVGQEVLRGKQLREGNVTCHEWLTLMIALLCHDIGYVKGVCQQDQLTERMFATGIDDAVITLPPGATDASLTPYHVDRSKQFVVENFSSHPSIDVAAIVQQIELTRFPVPDAPEYRKTGSYAGLARAADLIGQLSDPRYLDKLPALFHEFEEVGTTKALGYNHPADLRASYPKFFRHVVSPYLVDGIRYLGMTRQGRHILANLYANVVQVEREQKAASVETAHTNPVLEESRSDVPTMGSTSFGIPTAQPTPPRLFWGEFDTETTSNPLGVWADAPSRPLSPGDRPLGMPYFIPKQL